MTRGEHTALQEEFDTTLRSTGREGVEALLEYLRGTDFYKAPASTQYEGSYPGGLLEHSVKTCRLMLEKVKQPLWADKSLPEASVKIVALLHDLRKIGVYQKQVTNKKVYDPEAIKAQAPSDIRHDTVGDFFWQSVDTYRYEEQLPLGRSEKSLIIAMKYIKLTDDEIYALRWADGFSYAEGPERSQICNVFHQVPLALALYESNLEAMFIGDRKD